MSIGRRTRGASEQYTNESTRPAPVSRHDVVLALLPLAILLPAVASGLLGLPLHTGLAGGSIVGVLMLADALFLNPPIGGGPTN